MKKQKQEERKRHDWLRRQIELKESSWQGIENKERAVHESMQVEEIEENIRKIVKNMYGYRKGRWYIRICRGRNFDNLKRIPTNPELDPP